MNSNHGNSNNRANGKVKWFNNAKGYGFILPQDGNEDLFAHYSAIQMDGYKTLKAGQEVEFDIEEGPKGLHAVNIQAVEVGGTDHQEAQVRVSVELDISPTETYQPAITADASSAR